MSGSTLSEYRCSVFVPYVEFSKVAFVRDQFSEDFGPAMKGAHCSNVIIRNG